MAGACLLAAAIQAAEISTTERVRRAALTAPVAAKREAALDALIRTQDTDPDRLPLLVKLLDDEDQSVAGKAATVLSLYGERAFADLRETLRHGSAQQQWAAAVALYQMHASLVPLLPDMTAQLADGDDLSRRAILAALAHLKADAAPAVPALRPLLASEESEIRWATLQVLAAIGLAAKDAIPDVRNALDDKEVQVRLAAVEAFKAIQPPAPMPSAQIDAYIAWLREHVPALMQEHHVPGVSIAILQKNAMYWAQGFGVSDVRRQTPVTTATIFEACSMSKPVMTLSVLKLIERGQLDLDTPLVQYLGHDYVPDQPAHRRITARMVLTHRGGLPNWRMGYDEMGGPLPVLIAPGSDLLYSGEGILFLQRAMEAITGESLDALAGERVFTALNLEHTSFIWMPAIENDLASGHNEDGSFKERTHYRKANGAYSLYTTPTEYATLMLTLMQPAILGADALRPDTVALALERQQRMPDDFAWQRPGLARSVATYRALGWLIDVTAEGDLVEHSGSNSSGFRTFGQFNPNKGSGLVIFTNSDSGGAVGGARVGPIGGV
jgi:CubicO group peptidase (beta-lactamase class C family)